MKTAIVYYSMNGNTAVAAKELADATGADLIRILPEKAYPDKGLRKFLWGGKSAVMAETPKLAPYEFRAEDYGLIVIGFPVWAGNVAPPVRTFAAENRDALKDRRIAAFACQSGSGAERAFRKLLECLGRESFSATMVLIDPKDHPKAGNRQIVDGFLRKIREPEEQQERSITGNNTAERM